MTGRTERHHGQRLKAIGTGQINQHQFILAESVFHHIWLVNHQIASAALETLKITLTLNFQKKNSTLTSSD